MSFIRSNKAFTLFELIVAIAIVGLMMALVVSGLDRYLETDMKGAASRMSATIRYVYNKSVTEGTYLRLVLDLDEHTYWVEATRDPILMAGEITAKKKTAKEKKEGKKEEKEEKEGKEAENKANEEEVIENVGTLPKIKIKEPQFSQVDAFLIRPTRLPDGIFFKDVANEHQPLPVESGEVSVYFFPNGYVERTLINLRDEDDEIHYSLETNPITGAVKIEDEYKTLEKK